MTLHAWQWSIVFKHPRNPVAREPFNVKEKRVFSGLNRQIELIWYRHTISQLGVQKMKYCGPIIYKTTFFSRKDEINKEVQETSIDSSEQRTVDVKKNFFVSRLNNRKVQSSIRTIRNSDYAIIQLTLVYSKNKNRQNYSYYKTMKNSNHIKQWK